MVEELIDQIDWDGNIIAVRPASDLKKEMFPHRASLVIPRSIDGKYIFAKRAADKEPYPGVWVCGIGGKAKHGESYLEAAIRESEEEAGVTLPLEMIARFDYNKPEYQAKFFVYTTRLAIDLRKLQPDQSEIQYFRSFSLEEMVGMSHANPEAFAPTFRVALDAFAYAIETLKASSIV